ncbi:hypothetical protein EUGRSUZ_L00481 [Eucalyptus grandis]|uniref:HMA domain-containing protein n=1 Tax=Eucalyptus grandis TaxID=71139 RepID=A0A058ZWA3_EUCGR|nr:hypothetical protein EUGRSUZ_L00481 [Eucalyptus grandis]KAK2633147.1 hypothetical protein EUGRSUZ_L00481 [Eucalyptus grandis]
MGRRNRPWMEPMKPQPSALAVFVNGMTCGGCAASLKRILENQVSATRVNLTTETAIVWPVSEAKVIPNWQKELGINTCKTLRQIVAQV